MVAIDPRPSPPTPELQRDQARDVVAAKGEPSPATPELQREQPRRALAAEEEPPATGNHSYLFDLFKELALRSYGSYRAFIVRT